MSTDGPDGHHANNNDEEPSKDKKVESVFHPISLTGLVGDDDDDDESIDDAEEQPTKQARSTQQNGGIPLLHENAIEECFLLAINSHDTPMDTASLQAVWHWNKNHEAEMNGVEKVDMKVEEESLRSWVPRPMFLPTWAGEES